tara:strand:+ start:461 stop:742 length:282 start_codon:yes stop_codon:yes gene_type:complete
MFYLANRLKNDYIKQKPTDMTDKDLKKLEGLHGALTDKLLEIVTSGDAKAGDLNVARQFLKDNGIECIPTPTNGMEDLMSNLPDLEAIPASEL